MVRQSITGTAKTNDNVLFVKGAPPRMGTALLLVSLPADSTTVLLETKMAKNSEKSK